MSFAVILIKVTSRGHSVNIRNTSASYKKIFVAIIIVIIGHYHSYIGIIIWKCIFTKAKISLAIIEVKTMLYGFASAGNIISTCSYKKVKVSIFICIEEEYSYIFKVFELIKYFLLLYE